MLLRWQLWQLVVNTIFVLYAPGLCTAQYSNSSKTALKSPDPNYSDAALDQSSPAPARTIVFLTSVFDAKTRADALASPVQPTIAPPTVAPSSYHTLQTATQEPPGSTKVSPHGIETSLEPVVQLDNQPTDKPTSASKELQGSRPQNPQQYSPQNQEQNPQEGFHENPQGISQQTPKDSLHQASYEDYIGASPVPSFQTAHGTLLPPAAPSNTASSATRYAAPPPVPVLTASSNSGHTFSEFALVQKPSPLDGAAAILPAHDAAHDAAQSGAVGSPKAPVSLTSPLVVSNALPVMTVVESVVKSKYIAHKDDYQNDGETVVQGGQITKSSVPKPSASDGNVLAVDTSTWHIITDAPVSTTLTITSAGKAHPSETDSDSFNVDGQILTQGGQITVDGDKISYASDGSAVIVGSSTRVLKSSKAHPKLFTFGGIVYTANSASGFVIATQTLSPGSAITVSSHILSYQTVNGGNIVVDASTQHLASVTSRTRYGAFTFQSSVYTANPSGGYSIDSTTLVPGEGTVVSGALVSYDVGSGGHINISPDTASSASVSTQGEIITYNSSTYSTGSTGSQTAAPGIVITVSSKTHSLDTAVGINLTTDSSTKYLTPTATQKESEAINFEGTTYTANSLGDFIIHGFSLVPGGAITISGTPISYDTTNGGEIIFGSRTQFLMATATPEGPIIFGGLTYTTSSASAFVVGGMTLTLSGATTADLTPSSYPNDGTTVDKGSTTEDGGLGSLIMGGFGTGPALTNATTSATGRSTGPTSSNMGISLKTAPRLIHRWYCLLLALTILVPL